MATLLPDSWSTRSTLQPSLAKRVEIALPVPTPGPLEPAPVTMATLPSNLSLLSATWTSL